MTGKQERKREREKERGEKEIHKTRVGERRKDILPSALYVLCMRSGVEQEAKDEKREPPR